MSEETPLTPVDLGAGRMEAFSDAVMAVIITILALELQPPKGVSPAEIRDTLPRVFIYVLSFLFIAIYWNNHHHLLRATTRISAAVMWANMLLLFCLSLIPVSAEWLRQTYDQDVTLAVPVAFFGMVGLAAALSYTWLVRSLIHANGRDSAFARAIHRDFKGNVSLALYAAGVGLAFLNIYAAYACYAAVSVMWLIPDRRFTHEHSEAINDQEEETRERIE
jgi:uncharacterized membrane protein